MTNEFQAPQPAPAADVREEFERWAAEHEYDLRPECALRPDFGDAYISPSTENAWRTWVEAHEHGRKAGASRAADVCKGLWRIDGQFTADEFVTEVRADAGLPT